MPATQSSLDTFAAWSLIHWLAIAAAVLASLAFALPRRALRDCLSGRQLDLALAAFTLVFWIVIQIVQAWSDQFSSRTSLPLHVSDLTLLSVPFMLATRSAWPRDIVYFWGLALGSLAFIMPDLRDGPAKLGFWFFWISHIIIFAAAAYDVVGRRFQPAWRDFSRAAIGATIYVGVMLPFNAITRLSYGYVGPDQPDQPAILLYFGPWPWRAVPILLAAIVAMAALMIPWRFTRRPP